MSCNTKYFYFIKQDEYSRCLTLHQGPQTKTIRVWRLYFLFKKGSGQYRSGIDSREVNWHASSALLDQHSFSILCVTLSNSTNIYFFFQKIQRRNYHHLQWNWITISLFIRLSRIKNQPRFFSQDVCFDRYLPGRSQKFFICFKRNSKILRRQVWFWVFYD